MNLIRLNGSRLACIFVLLSVGILHAAPTPDWQKLEGCQLIQNEWNDGDSFHVRTAEGTEFIFRLYFVDTPETDNRFPDRVAEQARAFGISSEAALALGEKAKKFTATTLAAPFTVWTCWQKALGSSHLQRWYAMVETKQGWLDKLLVKNGLARIYGKRVTLPDGRDSRDYLAELQKLK